MNRLTFQTENWITDYDVQHTKYVAAIDVHLFLLLEYQTEGRILLPGNKKEELYL